MTHRLLEVAKQAKEALELVDANSVRWSFRALIHELGEAIDEIENDVKDVLKQDIENDPEKDA